MNEADTVSWQERWRIQMEDMAARSDTQYWNRRAEDYNNFIVSSSFEYGERMAEILQSNTMLGADSSVLEIASGVGAVTLPLARRAARVTAVEPAQAMADLLEENATAADINNITPEVTDFASFAAQTQDNAFDLAFLCHAAWQFPDAAWLIEEMSRLSSGYCCLADTMGQRDPENLAMQKKLGINAPEVDRPFYLYNVLNELGRPASLSNVSYVMRRSEDSARSMWTNLVSKYRTVSEQDTEMIDEHIASRSTDGVYAVPATMTMMWWKA